MAINYIKSVKPKDARGRVKLVYDQLKKEMGDVVEPISMHALHPELLKAIWNILRETVLVEDQVQRKDKEAVGAAVSSSNECPYCVDAHTIMIIGLKDKITAKAITSKKLDLISDPNLRNIVAWSFNTKQFGSGIVKLPPFSADEAPEIIGTAVFFHYLNRMVTIFLGPTILPMNISFLKEPMKSMAAAMFSKVLAEEKKARFHYADHAIDACPEDLYWSESNKRVSRTFAYFDQVLNEISEKYVPQQVKTFIEEQVADWSGSDLRNTKELDELVSSLSPRNQPMAKMLYLTVFAPHRIQDYHFQEFNLFYLGNDEAILGALSWASFAAAKKIGSQLGIRFIQKESAEVAERETFKVSS